MRTITVSKMYSGNASVMVTVTLFISKNTYKIILTALGCQVPIFEYEGGKLTAKTDLTEAQYNNLAYTTYLESSRGMASFWSESRDSKNALFNGSKLLGIKSKLTRSVIIIPTVGTATMT